MATSWVGDVLIEQGVPPSGLLVEHRHNQELEGAQKVDAVRDARWLVQVAGIGGALGCLGPDNGDDVGQERRPVDLGGRVLERLGEPLRDGGQGGRSCRRALGIDVTRGSGGPGHRRLAHQHQRYREHCERAPDAGEVSMSCHHEPDPSYQRLQQG